MMTPAHYDKVAHSIHTNLEGGKSERVTVLEGFEYGECWSIVSSVIQLF